MPIKWVGVPKEFRRAVRKQLRELPGVEWLVCSEKGRDQEARKHIRESLWAFNAEFISGHARGDLDDNAVKALRAAQEKLCEGANELVYSMIRSFKRFCREAVAADGYGHFLNNYDGRETEVEVRGDVLDRMITDNDGQTSRTFYAYRRN